MLVLSRKIGEKLVIGDNITVVVSRVAGNRVTLGIGEPRALVPGNGSQDGGVGVKVGNPRGGGLRRGRWVHADALKGQCTLQCKVIYHYRHSLSSSLSFSP